MLLVVLSTVCENGVQKLDVRHAVRIYTLHDRIMLDLPH